MRFRYKTLSFFVGLALGSVATGANAAPMQEARADWTVGTPVGSNPGSASQTTSGPTGSVDVIPSASSGLNSVFAHSYGSVSGFGSVFFGSRASGFGTYDMKSSYKMTDMAFTVGGIGPKKVYFNFVIDNGELAVYCEPPSAGPPPTAGNCVGGGSAAIDLTLNVSTTEGGAGTDVASGSGLLTVDDNGATTLTHSGLVSTLSNATTTPTSYSWNSTSVTQLLGTFDGGTTLFIDYELITQAKGEFENGAGGFGQHCYVDGGEGGVGRELAAAFVQCYEGNTIARSGDPFTQTGRGAFAVAAVPAPGSLALVAAALAAAWATTGRRRKKKS